MTLPAWIEDISKEQSTSQSHYVPRLVQALGIAIEALSKEDSASSQQALRDIEALGESK